MGEHTFGLFSQNKIEDENINLFLARNFDQVSVTKVTSFFQRNFLKRNSKIKFELLEFAFLS